MGGTADLSDCMISDNSARGDGGAVQLPSGTATLTNCTVSGNSAGGLGLDPAAAWTTLAR